MASHRSLFLYNPSSSVRFTSSRDFCPSTLKTSLFCTITHKDPQLLSNKFFLKNITSNYLFERSYTQSSTSNSLKLPTKFRKSVSLFLKTQYSHQKHTHLYPSHMFLQLKNIHSLDQTFVSALDLKKICRVLCQHNQLKRLDTSWICLLRVPKKSIFHLARSLGKLKSLKFLELNLTLEKAEYSNIIVQNLQSVSQLGHLGLSLNKGLDKTTLESLKAWVVHLRELQSLKIDLSLDRFSQELANASWDGLFIELQKFNLKRLQMNMSQVYISKEMWKRVLECLERFEELEEMNLYLSVRQMDNEVMKMIAKVLSVLPKLRVLETEFTVFQGDANEGDTDVAQSLMIGEKVEDVARIGADSMADTNNADLEKMAGERYDGEEEFKAANSSNSQNSFVIVKEKELVKRKDTIPEKQGNLQVPFEKIRHIKAFRNLESLSIMYHHSTPTEIVDTSKFLLGFMQACSNKLETVNLDLLGMSHEIIVSLLEKLSNALQLHRSISKLKIGLSVYIHDSAYFASIMKTLSMEPLSACIRTLNLDIWINFKNVDVALLSNLFKGLHQLEHLSFDLLMDNIDIEDSLLQIDEAIGSMSHLSVLKVIFAPTNFKESLVLSQEGFLRDKFLRNVVGNPGLVELDLNLSPFWKYMDREALKRFARGLGEMSKLERFYCVCGKVGSLTRTEGKWLMNGLKGRKLSDLFFVVKQIYFEAEGYRKKELVFGSVREMEKIVSNLSGEEQDGVG